MTGDERDPQATARLRALGSQPIAPEVGAAVRARMANAEQSNEVRAPTDLAVRGHLRSKRRVAALVAAGVLATSGAAAATIDSLPAPIQRVAHRAFDRVGIGVPDRPAPALPPTGQTPPASTSSAGATTTPATTPTPTTVPGATTSGTSSSTTTTTAGQTSTTSSPLSTTTEPARTTSMAPARPDG